MASMKIERKAYKAIVLMIIEKIQTEEKKLLA
jgi:hypothetical protein